MIELSPPAAITAARLQRFAPRCDYMGLGPHLERARERAELNTPRRVKHFMAQLHHESGGLTRFEESFRYRPERLDAMFSAVRGLADAEALLARGPAAVASRVYANRLGNGDEASGDGWRFRGRGLVQLTGRANYAAASEDLGLDLEANPDLAARPDVAAAAAASWWRRAGANAAADRDDVAGVTRIVNGPALAGLEDRARLALGAGLIWRDA